MLEAGACGTTAVVPALLGFSDSVIDGKTGRTYIPGDVGEMASRLFEILTDDGGRKELARHAESFAGSFTWERHVAEMERFLESSLCQRQSNPG